MFNFNTKGYEGIDDGWEHRDTEYTESKRSGRANKRSEDQEIRRSGF
jgi:hypothetical protein